MRQLTINGTEVRVFNDAQELSRATANDFQQAARAAVEERGRFAVALAGGSTPRAVYSLLGEDQVSGNQKLPWESIHLFFGDERPVPPEHAESNYRMAHEVMLSRLLIPAANVHRIQGELPATTAAEKYERDLRAFFAVQAGQWPRFDLILLGMGTDGHTASLFPGTTALHESARWVCANWVPQLGQHRITLTFPVLNAAARVRFLVCGPEKAVRLREVLWDGPTQGGLPAQRVRPVPGNLIWLADEAAASRLSERGARPQV